MSKICAIAQTVLAGQKDITRVDIDATNATLYKEKDREHSEVAMTSNIILTNLGSQAFQAEDGQFVKAQDWSQPSQTAQTCTAVFDRSLK